MIDFRMKKVYFNLRNGSRERMWDSAEHASDACNPLYPSSVKKQSSVSIHSSTHKWLKKFKNFISQYLLNKQSMDKKVADESNLLYFWGALPKKSNKPFIIELDNPYSLAFYDTKNFHSKQKEILAYLQRAHKIVYLSQASKQHTLALFSDSMLASKSIVQYPYVKKQDLKQRDEKIINFVFVGLNLDGKGGNELLKAFSNVADQNIRLTFISNTSEAIQRKYAADERILFLPPQLRENLLEYIYPKMDVMVFPSFYESFGMVLLEALSFGMGIITTNLYATPEMVHDNINGKLLHHPFIAPTYVNDYKIINCVEQKSEVFYGQYLQNNEFYYGLYSEIKQAIEDAIVNYKEWQKNSEKLFDNTFAPHIWRENFKRIIEET